MSPKAKIVSTVSLAILFSYLFYQQNIGVNLLLFEAVGLLLLLLFKQIDLKRNILRFALIGVILSLGSYMINYSAFALIMNFLFGIFFIGLLSYPELKNKFLAFFIAGISAVVSPVGFVKNLSENIKNSNRFLSKLWRAKMYIVPILVALVFISIYRNSNPFFNNIIGFVEKHTFDKIPNVFDFIDIPWLSVFIWGLLISGFIFIRYMFADIVLFDKQHPFEITRNNKSPRYFSFKPNALQTEAKLGVVLFITLNTILLVLNCIDIYWVWFNFKWDGGYLKQFVHEGTYLLILSILLSIVLVLYYFRANQNFNPKNKLLQKLSYVWLIQNAILCLSVGIRNYWYIDYFNLAYKRIGVIIFLVITLYGLYTVYVKVKNKRSLSYLISTNTLSILSILLLSSIFNWDSIIAKYNFRNADKSFLHLNFMIELSDKSLPYLDKSLQELESIEKNQSILFDFEKDYLSARDYYTKLQERKEAFLNPNEHFDWRSWNYAEYNARKRLKQ